MPSRIILARHGETRWSISGQHTGLTDIPLTEHGHEAARALGRRLAKDPYDGLPGVEVRSSPLRRALDTARLAGFGDRVEPWDDLHEWNYGDYEGHTTEEIRAKHPDWLLWRDGVPGGETIEQVAKRVDRVIAWVRGEDGSVDDADTAGCDVLLFAHGHVLRILTARWLGLDPRFGQQLKLAPAALSILSWGSDAPSIELWNDTNHLD